MHARLAYHDLTSEQVVEIAERIEEVEATQPAPIDDVAVPSQRAGAEEGAPADLDQVIDAAAAEATETEPGSGSGRRASAPG